jgi:hypothetical protein
MLHNLQNTILSGDVFEKRKAVLFSAQCAFKVIHLFANGIIPIFNCSKIFTLPSNCNKQFIEFGKIGLSFYTWEQMPCCKPPWARTITCKTLLFY